MSNNLPRRDVLKAAAAVAAGSLFAPNLSAQDADGPEEWGGWFAAAEGNKHMPVVSVSRHGEEVDIQLDVRHPQGAAHHISNVRIYDENRIEIATAEFHPTSSTPRATLTLRIPEGRTLYAVSNCNKHGLWYRKFEV